jgi:hypothetical protein
MTATTRAVSAATDVNTNAPDFRATSSLSFGADSVNLFVNYLPLSVTDAELLQKFEAFGAVLSAKVMRHLNSSQESPLTVDTPATTTAAADASSVQKSKGYGFVLMADQVAAAAAIDGLHSSSWLNKRLVVQVAQRLPADTVDVRTGLAASATAPSGLNINAASFSSTERYVTNNSLRISSSRDVTEPLTVVPRVQADPVPTSRKRLSQQQPDQKVLPTAAATTATAPAPAHSLRMSDVAVATVEIGPVDPQCTLSRLCKILDNYGVIASATMAPGGFARITFSTAASAVEAVRWLNNSRVPQVNPRQALQVRLVSTTKTKRSKSGSKKEKTSKSAQSATRLELSVPASADMSQPYYYGGFTTHVSESARLLGSLQRAPAAVAPAAVSSAASKSAECPHGAHCYCGAMPDAKPNDALYGRSSAPAAAAGLPPVKTPGSPVHAVPRHHDPYTVLPVNAEPPRVMPAPPPVAPVAEIERAECVYCDLGTTIILQNMPFNDTQCEMALNELLGQIGYFRYWECWGDGRAIAVFPDYYNALEAVELLQQTCNQADFYHCLSGMPLSEYNRQQALLCEHAECMQATPAVLC